MMFTLVLSIIFVALGLWVFICNGLTYSQRVKLVHRCNRFEELKLLDDVTYEDHLWRLMTLRDPWVIYPEALSSLVRVRA